MDLFSSAAAAQQHCTSLFVKIVNKDQE